jgi:quercetin dioxygenase-like cupin family protein
MVNRRILMQSTSALLAQALVSNAQTSTPPRGPIFQHDLPNVNMNNWAVTVVEVNYAPGQSSNAHRHPGITIVYVLEGEIVSKVGDGPEKTYSVGQMFLETPNELHGVSRNASKTQPAKFLALLLAEKGKQLTTPA